MGKDGVIGGFQVGPFQPLPAYQQGSQVISVIDTHDGGDRKRYDEKRRAAAARLRQQLTDSIDPQAAARDGAAAIPYLAPGSAAAAVTPGFDFDADDEEIILLI